MVPTGLRQVLNYINSYVAYRDARGFVHNINCHLKTIARSFKETCGDLFILAQKTEEISIKKKTFLLHRRDFNCLDKFDPHDENHSRIIFDVFSCRV